MDREFFPTGAPAKLELHHPAANYGREDPTLFEFRGKLHVAFVGVQGHDEMVLRTNMLYARLGDEFAVEELFSLTAPGVDPRRWQKNWSFFVHSDQLYCVYSVSPHRILKIDGDQCSWAQTEPFPFTWVGGELRGGATPVRVGSEFWHFVHDRVEQPGSKHHYRMGLYTFSAIPPFRPLRLVPDVLLEADPKTNYGNYCDVVFPRGAVRDGDLWVVSMGCHDQFTELRAFSHSALEARMASFPDPLPKLMDHWERHVEGWCGRGKMELLTHLALTERPELCIEVGVYHGQSLLPVAAALRHNGTGRIWAIDPWAVEPTQEGTNPDTERWWTKLDFEQVKASFDWHVREAGLSDWVHVNRAPSQEALTQFADESADLIHVDGNHSPEVALADVSGYWAKLKPGGVMVVDDTDWATLGDALAWLNSVDAVLETDCTRFRVYRKARGR